MPGVGRASSAYARLRSRIDLLHSSFGLTRRFRVMILSRTFESFTTPQWQSIYLKENLCASDEGIGLVNAVQSGVSLLMLPAGAAFGQKFRKKKLYLLGLAIQASAFLVAFLARDWTWAILMSVMLGCSALVSPAIAALVGRITDGNTRTLAFAFQDTVLTIVAILSGPAQGLVAERVGLRPLYLLAVVGSAVSFLVFWALFQDVREGDADGKPGAEGRSEGASTKGWRDQVRQVFARPEYRRNFIGLMQAGIVWRLFINSTAPFIDIYLYEEIGWSFIFFGFYNAISSFTILVLKIPFGALIDRYNLKRICFAFPQAFHGIVFLLMAFIRDPYIIAGMFLMESITGSAHMLSVGPLWYEAIPPEVYPIGAAVRGVIYGCFGMVGSILGAYLWSSLGPINSFYIMSSTYIVSALVAYWLIRDFKRGTPAG